MKAKKTPAELCLSYVELGLAIRQSRETLLVVLKKPTGVGVIYTDGILRECEHLSKLLYKCETALFTKSKSIGVTPVEVFSDDESMQKLRDQYQRLVDNP